MEMRSDAEQRHHDYYVEQWRGKKLPLEDVPNLQLAKQREKRGEVKPLPGGRFDSLKLLLTTLNYKLAQSRHGSKSLLPKQQVGENSSDVPEEQGKI